MLIEPSNQINSIREIEWTSLALSLVVDVAGIEPVPPCLQSRTIASDSSFCFL
jgi:hypothetical protein